jgi:hypothetical protein
MTTDLEKFRSNWEALINTNTKRYYIKDPYGGGEFLRTSTREEMFNWCDQYCKGMFWIGMRFGQFELDSDATLFLLRWA